MLLRPILTHLQCQALLSAHAVQVDVWEDTKMTTSSLKSAFTCDLCLLSIRQMHTSEEALMTWDKGPDAVCELHADAYTLCHRVSIW